MDECDRICAAVAQDVGKTAEEVIGGEVLPTADALRFLERQATSLLTPRRVPRSQRPIWLWGQSDTVFHRPRGVVGVIGTWNYPVFLNAVQIGQALTAGNAVLWKPSEVAPASARLLHDLFMRAGFPASLFQVLEPTRENGELLLEADIDHLVFTGSAAVGRKIARRLGERLISSTLELSGIDAQFVLDDADLDLSVAAAWFGATVNRGQTCIAVRRVFVDSRLYDDFCKSLADRAFPSLRLAQPGQAEQATRLVQDAVATGARVLNGQDGQFGGKQATEWKPTILADARPGMALCQEASFAPLMALFRFNNLDEALAMERQCPFALGASVFTRQPQRALELAARLRPGMITVNDVIAPTAHPATPFGGRAQSGWGVTQGAEGLLEMTVPQVVSVRTNRYRPHYDLAAGQGGGQEKLVRGLLEATHGPTLLRRLRGWAGVVRAFMR